MKKWLFLFPLLASSLIALPTRNEVPEEDRWNTAELYESPQAWEKELGSLQYDLSKYQGRLSESPQYLHEALRTNFEVDRKITKLYVYAQLCHHVDMADACAKANYDKIVRLAQDYNTKSCWIQPEILSLPEKRLKEYIDHPCLKEYKILLTRLLEQKPHVRNQSEEELIALCLPAMGTSSRVFSLLDNADFSFGSVEDSNGKLHELTHASYSKLLESSDRVLRKNAFMALSNKYLDFENSLTELLAGTVKGHHFTAKARNYNSCLEAALKPKDIDVKVYHSLIEAVHSRVGLYHRYTTLRKKLLRLDELHNYDLYVPIVEPETKNYTYEEARELVIESVQPLGKAYATELEEGLKTRRWVDRYENQNKRSGAYSSGCYDSLPYILMNFSGTFRDVFTLAHESGHSMHSQLSKQHQPFQYAEYPIFVAEVASTHNEELLHAMLLKRAKSKAVRAAIIDQKLEDMSAILFRQTMLAEFELFVHEAEENGLPITPKLLKDKYAELLKFYLGPDFTLDPEAAIGWARVPHLHYNFYVYQYATGIAAALCLSDRVLNGKLEDREAYLAFLSSGSSDTPLNILAKAGCDMRTPKPVQRALDQYEALINSFEQLMDKPLCENG